MLQIVIYKKLNFWEEYTPLDDDDDDGDDNDDDNDNDNDDSQIIRTPHPSVAI